MTRVINFLAGPGAGKSTTATGVFSGLKRLGRLAEYVSEFAKDCAWEETEKMLENQLHVFAEQHRRQFRLIDKVDFIVTDSPLLLSSIYYDYHRSKLPKSKQGSPWFADSFHSLVKSTFLGFENEIYYINRDKPYVRVGRSQSEEEARQLDEAVRFYLEKNDIYYRETTSSQAISDVLQDMTGEPYTGLQWAEEARDG